MSIEPAGSNFVFSRAAAWAHLLGNGVIRRPHTYTSTIRKTIWMTFAAAIAASTDQKIAKLNMKSSHLLVSSRSRRRVANPRAAFWQLPGEFLECPLYDCGYYD